MFFFNIILFDYCLSLRTIKKYLSIWKKYNTFEKSFVYSWMNKSKSKFFFKYCYFFIQYNFLQMLFIFKRKNILFPIWIMLDNIFKKIIIYS